MAVVNIFIAGFETSGTTALPESMVTAGPAEDRVPGEKKPFLYANDEPHPARARKGELPLLEASASEDVSRYLQSFYTGADLGEARPDFSDKAFDLLRASFRYDLSEASGLIAKTRFGDSLLDNAALDRYLEPR